MYYGNPIRFTWKKPIDNLDLTTFSPDLHLGSTMHISHFVHGCREVIHGKLSLQGVENNWIFTDMPEHTVKPFR